MIGFKHQQGSSFCCRGPPFGQSLLAEPNGCLGPKAASPDGRCRNPGAKGDVHITALGSWWLLSFLVPGEARGPLCWDLPSPGTSPALHGKHRISRVYDVSIRHSPRPLNLISDPDCAHELWKGLGKGHVLSDGTLQFLGVPDSRPSASTAVPAPSS